MVVGQFDVIRSKRLYAAKDLGEPREVSRFLRHINPAFGLASYLLTHYLSPSLP